MTRRFISSTVFLSFLILFLTSFVLYVIPGSQAGAAGWSFMGLERIAWVDLHITSGLLFLAFGLWHTVFNWKSLVSIFRKAASFNLRSAWPFLGALVLNAFIVAGTLGHLQPVETVISFYKQTKGEFRSGAGGGQRATGRPASTEASAANVGASAPSTLNVVNEKGDLANFSLINDLPSSGE